MKSSAGVAGFIFPGDHVDIVLTQQVPGGGDGPPLKVSETIVRNVRVLATDRATIADFQAFCRETGHALLAWSEEAGVFSFLIRRRAEDANEDA